MIKITHFIILLLAILLACKDAPKAVPEEFDGLETVSADSSVYEIIELDKRPLVDNFHVWLKTGQKDQLDLTNFAINFRKRHCKRNCNVNMYDTDEIRFFIGLYPLEGKQYIQFAEHFIAKSSFDSPYPIWKYPLKDVKYVELGGKK